MVVAVPVARSMEIVLAALVAAGVAVAVVLVAWEFAIARHRDRAACFRAFLHNHWVGATIFAGFAAALWARGG